MTMRDKNRVVVQERPFNAETSLALLREYPTPLGRMFVRSNFDMPSLDAADYALDVAGTRLTLDELRPLRRRTVALTLECAGNGRAFMTPLPSGTPWRLGATGSAIFTGASLRDVLEAARVEPGACEIVFHAHDRGEVEPGRVERFARSLPVAEALRPDVILAWEMNGAPLPREHGAPLRLVVPGWYGIASVKWLARVEPVDEPFAGHFQRERYVYVGDPRCADATPVTRIHVRSLITAPAEGDELRVGDPIRIEGVAWSGFAPIARVEVRAEDEVAWRPATLEPSKDRYVRTAWHATWTPPRAGEFVLRARAHDASGGVQPLDAPHNVLGYANNVVHAVRVTAR